jgi:hypothetical protein
VNFGAKNFWVRDCGPQQAERELSLGEGPKFGWGFKLAIYGTAKLIHQAGEIVAPKILWGSKIVGNTSCCYFVNNMR